MNHARADRLDRCLSLLAPVRQGEGYAVSVLFLQAFSLMLAYYLVRPVREALILTQGGAEFRSYAVAVQVDGRILVAVGTAVFVGVRVATALAVRTTVRVDSTVRVDCTVAVSAATVLVTCAVFVEAGAVRVAYAVFDGALVA